MQIWEPRARKCCKLSFCSKQNRWTANGTIQKRAWLVPLTKKTTNRSHMQRNIKFITSQKTLLSLERFWRFLWNQNLLPLTKDLAAPLIHAFLSSSGLHSRAHPWLACKYSAPGRNQPSTSHSSLHHRGYSGKQTEKGYFRPSVARPWIRVPQAPFSLFLQAPTMTGLRLNSSAISELRKLQDFTKFVVKL